MHTALLGLEICSYSLLSPYLTSEGKRQTQVAKVNGVVVLDDCS